MSLVPTHWAKTKGATMNPRTTPRFSRKALIPVAVVAGIMLMTPFLRAGAHNGPDSEQSASPPTVFRLANGLTVILHRDPDLPLVTIEAAVKNGSFTEPPDMNGLSHLYEHMFFKGNAAYPDQKRALERIRSLGMVFNGTTSEEVVTYYFSLSSRRLAQGLAFMRDALLTPRFDPTELAKERQVVLAEYDRAEANPNWVLRREVDKALWYRYWSRKNPIGSREVVSHATVGQMRRIQQLYYQPSNTALILSGDVTLSQVRPLVSKLFGSWKGRPVTLPNLKHPDLTGHKVLFVHRPVQTVTLLVALQGPSLRDDPNATYAADVLTYAINQRAGLVQRRLVRSGLALSLSAMYLTRRSKGPIYFMLTTTPDKALSAAEKLVKILPVLAAPQVVTDAEIAAAKRLLAVQDVYDREAPASYAHLLGHWWATAGLDYYLTYISRLSRVTRTDIQHFVDRYIRNRPMVVGLLVSRQAAAKAGITEKAVRAILPHYPPWPNSTYYLAPPDQAAHPRQPKQGQGAPSQPQSRTRGGKSSTGQGGAR